MNRYVFKAIQITEMTITVSADSRNDASELINNQQDIPEECFSDPVHRHEINLIKVEEQE